MNTKYSDIFELVLALMKSYEINTIYTSGGESGITTFFLPYLKIASAELENNNSDINLSNRDDILSEFNEYLSDGKQLIIAKYVMIGYLSRETYDILQMKLHLQDGDFKTYAEKNNLDGKLNALYSLKEEVGYDLKKTGYNNFLW
jgi:hypothetical protein